MKLQAAAALVLFFGPIILNAQDRTDFSQLQTKLKQNDTVTVETATGVRVSGKLDQVSVARIVLQTTSGRQSISAPQVVKVQRRQNGVLLGAAIGAGASIPFAILLSEYSYNEGRGRGSGITLVALGLAAGVGIDAALPSTKTVYDRNTKTRVEIRPVINRSRLGGEVAFRF